MTIGFNPTTIATTRILIESGTWKGDFCEKVKNDYQEIHTIEIIEELYNKATERFKNDAHITCHFGNSPEILSKILANINEPATFWLDAHYSYGNQPNDTRAPLIQELDVIAKHTIKQHMIMIDDIRLFHEYGTSVAEVSNILRSINNNYIIKQYPGFKGLNDVLVARV